MNTFAVLAEEFLMQLARTLRERPSLRGELRSLLQPEAPPPEPERLYVTVAEYAERLRLSKRTVENLIREGLPILGRGRRRRVSVVDADHWMQGPQGRTAIESRARASARNAAMSRLQNGGKQ